MEVGVVIGGGRWNVLELLDTELSQSYNALDGFSIRNMEYVLLLSKSMMTF